MTERKTLDELRVQCSAWDTLAAWCYWYGGVTLGTAALMAAVIAIGWWLT